MTRVDVTIGYTRQTQPVTAHVRKPNNNEQGCANAPATHFGACLSASAQTALVQETPREDKHYAGLLVTAFNHRTIGSTSNEQATGSGAAVMVGIILTTCFMRRCVLAEVSRCQVPKGDLTLSINYFASWYMGLHYPVTDYANVYAQAGFSFIHGTAEMTLMQTNRQMPSSRVSDRATFQRQLQRKLGVWHGRLKC